MSYFSIGFKIKYKSTEGNFLIKVAIIWISNQRVIVFNMIFISVNLIKQIKYHFFNIKLKLFKKSLKYCTWNFQ